MSWENCVLACKDMNSRRANRLPEEVGAFTQARPLKSSAHTDLTKSNPFIFGIELSC